MIRLTSRRSQPPLALSVPLPRFTSRVGGGSAFFVRPLDNTQQQKNTKMKTTSLVELTKSILYIVGIFTLCSTSVLSQVYQDYSNAHIKNTTGGPLDLISIGSSAELFITGKEAWFDSKGNLSKGSGYIQANPGKYFSVVVTVSPSDAHTNDLNFTQFQLGVTRMEFDDNAVPTVVVGLNPTIQTLFGTELKTTSTGRLVATNGVVVISLEDGHKLSIPLNSSRYSRMNNADFLLTPKTEKK